MNIGSNWHALNIDEFTDYDNESKLVFTDKDMLVSFQVSDLIREFKAKDIKVLPILVDLESFDKQMSQEGNDLRNFENWKAINMLKFHKVIYDGFELKENTFKLFLEYLASLFLNLLENNEEEKMRFNEIELKINNLIYERQLQGVRIDKDIAEQKCLEIEKEIYKIKNILQLKHNIFMPDDEKQQKAWLISKKYNIIQSLLYSFKIRRNDDNVCLQFYELIRNQQDLESLLFMLSHWGGEERTYPSYVGFGTITSRITLRQPSLQNIRKVNRSAIIADIGKKLLYVDYSQFEAGILASLSKDDQLIMLYNEDIYKDLANKVLNDEGKRSEAKIIFYRYMYGDTSLGRKEKAYFTKFEKLNQFKLKIEKELKTNNRIGTINGNYRRRNDDEESNWGLSHVIQSTASLIFKNAILSVHKEVPNANFLIPMHDAALYQIFEFQYEVYKQKIQEIFKQEFVKICPQIKPIVNCEDFYVEKLKI